MDRFYLHPLFICRHLNKEFTLTTVMSWDMKTHQIFVVRLDFVFICILCTLCRVSHSHGFDSFCDSNTFGILTN